MVTPITATELLRELIRIPSVNPAFAEGNGAWAGEERVGRYLAGLARQAGLRVAWQSVGQGRRNLFVTLPARKRRHRRILLAPHLDTVGISEASQLEPERTRGRIYGRGACDTKGSVAAMFQAMLQVASLSERPRDTEIQFVGLADEEHAQLGSRALAAKAPAADLAVVGEPTRLATVVAHKGVCWLRLETRGKAAHGSRPELGRNAILAMAQMVVALETGYAERLREKTHPLLGAPTVNVGIIRGGKQPNIVPDACSVRIDRRTLPQESVATVRKELMTIARETGVKIRIEDLRGRPGPALETDVTLPQVQEFLRSMNCRQGTGADYFCDAAILAEAGIPCVVFGPGDIAQAHTEREWIAERSLERGTGLLRRYLMAQP